MTNNIVVLALAVGIGACGGRIERDAAADPPAPAPARGSATPLHTDEEALARCNEPWPEGMPSHAPDGAEQLAGLLAGRWRLCHTWDQFSAPDLFFGATDRVGMEIGSSFAWLATGPRGDVITTDASEWSATDQADFVVGPADDGRRSFWVSFAPTNDRARMGSPELGSRTYDFVRVR